MRATSGPDATSRNRDCALKAILHEAPGVLFSVVHNRFRSYNAPLILLFVLCIPSLAYTCCGGTLSGVGLILGRDQQRIVVGGVSTNSPASRSSLVKPGDIIIAVGQGERPPVEVTNLPLEDVVGMIRGPTGTVVRLTIISGGTNISEPHVVGLVRGQLSTLLSSNHVLDSGTMAPEAKFFEIPDMRTFSLTSLRGRVVVLEFWATWCGPCQESMLELQSLTQKTADWQGKVAFVSANVDDDARRAENWVKKNAWNKTFNVWSDSTCAEAFGVSSLPLVYILDREGKIVTVGHTVDGGMIEKVLSP